MKTNYLFPNKLKWISGVLFVISFSLLAGLYIFDRFGEFEYKMKVFAIIADNGMSGESKIFRWVENSVLDELLMLFVIPSGIVFAFSKEKQEDEMVAIIRLHSLAWATILNYAILLLCYLFIYDFSFLNVLMGAMFSQLLIFIILFRFKIYQLNNSAPHEE